MTMGFFKRLLSLIWGGFPIMDNTAVNIIFRFLQKGKQMDNNLNENQNWQAVLNEFDNTAPTTDNTVAAEQAQPQQTVPEQQTAPLPQFSQADGMFNAQPQGMPGYNAADFAVMPVKKKAGVLPIVLIVVAAAILVGGLIFAYFTFFAKSNSGYEKMERDYFASVGNTFNDVIPSGKVGNEVVLKITPDASIFGTELSPTVLSIKSSSDIDANKSFCDLIYKSGESDILSCNLWADGDTIYLKVPELSDKIIKVNAADFASLTQSGYNDFDDYYTEPMMESFDSSSFSEIEGFLSSISSYSIDEKTAEKILNIVSDAYFKTFSDATEGSESFTIGGISKSCNTYTITFTAKNIVDFAIEVLTAAQKDDELMTALASCGLDSATISAAISYLEESLSSMTEEEAAEVLGTMTVYSDNNEIIGRTFSFANGTLEGTFGHVENNGSYAFEYSISGNGEKYLDVSGSGTVDGNKYDGTATFTASGSEILSAEYSLTVDEYVNGTLSLTIKADENTITLNASIEDSENSGKVTLDVLSGGVKAVSIEISGATTSYEEITIPADDANIVEITEDNADEAMESFTADVAANISKITDKMYALDTPDILAMLIVGFSGASSNIIA